MRPQRRTVVVAWVGLLILILAGCRTDWTTWGNGVERQGSTDLNQGLGPENVAGLHHLWSVDLGAYINAAPIVAVDIPVNGTPTDVVYVGTEHGDFYAVDTDGTVLWSRNLGSHVANCPDTPDSRYGVQASAVFDRVTNRVYVMGGNGYAYALDASTGDILAGWPQQITTDPVHESFYSAPNLFGDRLYIPTAAHCDQRPYKGRVVAIDVKTLERNTWWVTGLDGNGPDGGGIWGWGGVSIDPADGNVYVATGNVFSNPENAFLGDSVVRLTPTLDVVASHTPQFYIRDDDFGSTPTLFQKDGCPKQFAVEQKNGSLLLYDRDTMAAGYRQRIVMSEGEDFNHDPIPVDEFIGVPAWSGQTQMLYVANPTGTPDGTFGYGMVAFRHDANCNLVKAWETQAGAKTFITSTPTVANNVVYYASGAEDHVYAFDARTGQELWNSGSDVTAPIFTAPTVVNGMVFAGAYDDHLHAWGL